MKKKRLILFAAILIVSLMTGCDGRKNDLSDTSSHLDSIQTTDTTFAIDMEKIEETMAIATTKYGDERSDMSVTSSQLSASQTTDTMSAIDMEKLDEAMSITDLLLKTSLGSDYSLVYDQEGVIISFSKENAAQAATLAKNGNSKATELWGQIVEGMKSITTTLQDILEESDLGDIPVTVQCFDTENMNSALAIVVDGIVTYDASK